MPKFITLTDNDSNEWITVNVDKIISFRRRSGGSSDYTLVDLDGADGNLTVSETPQQISDAIEAEL
jgi:hypothetical protein